MYELLGCRDLGLSGLCFVGIVATGLSGILSNLFITRKPPKPDALNLKPLLKSFPRPPGGSRK